MGGAILDGWRMGGLDLSPVTVIRPSGKPVEGARVVTSRRRGRARRRSSWCSRSSRRSSTRSRPSFASIWVRETIVVSILAGVEMRQLRQRFPERGGNHAGDAEPAGGGSSRRDRSLQRRGWRSALKQRDRQPVRWRSAMRCGWPTSRSSRHSARSPARGRPMSRASSRRSPRRV